MEDDHWHIACCGGEKVPGSIPGSTKGVVFACSLCVGVGFLCELRFPPTRLGQLAALDLRRDG